MAWLDHSPNVLTNTQNELVIEESHFNRFGIILVGIFLCCLFVIPAILTGTLLGAIIGIVMGTIIFGVPFLVVLAISRWRRLEVLTGNEVRSTAFNPLFGAKTTRFSWDEIARIVYERRRDSQPHRLGRLRVFLYTTSGTKHQLLRGWYTEELKPILQQRFGHRYEYVETQSLWIRG